MNALMNKVAGMMAASHSAATKLDSAISLRLTAYPVHRSMVAAGTLILVEIMSGAVKGPVFQDYHLMAFDLGGGYLFCSRRELQKYIEEKCAEKKFSVALKPNHLLKKDDKVYACLDLVELSRQSFSFLYEP